MKTRKFEVSNPRTSSFLSELKYRIDGQTDTFNLVIGDLNEFLFQKSTIATSEATLALQFFSEATFACLSAAAHLHCHKIISATTLNSHIGMLNKLR